MFHLFVNSTHCKWHSVHTTYDLLIVFMTMLSDKNRIYTSNNVKTTHGKTEAENIQKTMCVYNGILGGFMFCMFFALWIMLKFDISLKYKKKKKKEKHSRLEKNKETRLVRQVSLLLSSLDSSVSCVDF